MQNRPLASELYVCVQAQVADKLVEIAKILREHSSQQRQYQYTLSYVSDLNKLNGKLLEALLVMNGVEMSMYVVRDETDPPN